MKQRKRNRIPLGDVSCVIDVQMIPAVVIGQQLYGVARVVHRFVEIDHAIEFTAAADLDPDFLPRGAGMHDEAQRLVPEGLDAPALKPVVLLPMSQSTALLLHSSGRSMSPVDWSKGGWPVQRPKVHDDRSGMLYDKLCSLFLLRGVQLWWVPTHTCQSQLNCPKNTHI